MVYTSFLSASDLRYGYLVYHRLGSWGYDTFDNGTNGSCTADSAADGIGTGMFTTNCGMIVSPVRAI